MSYDTMGSDVKTKSMFGNLFGELFIYFIIALISVIGMVTSYLIYGRIKPKYGSTPSSRSSTPSSRR